MIREPFILFSDPDHAQRKAAGLVNDAINAYAQMAYALSQLHRHSGEYVLDAVSVARLEVLMRNLMTEPANVDEILAANAPAPALMAAE